MDIFAHIWLGVQAVFLGPPVIEGLPISITLVMVAFGFLTGTANLNEDYHVRLLSSRAWRFRGHILELRPKRHDPNVRRVVLYVDADPSRAGVVHRLRIDDHAGNRNKFELRGMRFNRDISDSFFHFTPPPGTEIVQR